MKLATVLEAPFFSLINLDDKESSARGVVIRRLASPHVAPGDGGFKSRAQFPLTGERSAEFYQIRIAAGYEEFSDAHALGATEYIVVVSGSVEIEAGGAAQRMEAGDAIVIDADQLHVYRNPGDGEAVLHLVLQYVLRGSLVRSRQCASAPLRTGGRRRFIG